MTALESSTISKMKWRLLPFFFLCYIFAYLDRANVSVAALQMNADLHFTATIYAFGGGIFFLGYFLFEIPSNWALEKVGARIWISRIMITWGIFASFTAFVWNAESFYWARFLLGAGEAGFFPGIVLYLSRWFPVRQRTAIISLFFLGNPLSFVIGAPLSGALLGLDGIWGLAGWKWLFLLEGIPTILLGIACLWVMTDKPNEAKWLEPAEREWLTSVLAKEEAQRAKTSTPSFWSALYNPGVWAFSLAYVGIIMGVYGISLWLPQIVKPLGYSNFITSVISAVPSLLAAVVMVIWAKSSDKSNERRWHAIIPCLICAVGLIGSAIVGNPIISLIALTIANIGIISSLPTFWALPTVILSGAAAAGGIALINSVGNLGGFAGPYLVGYLKDATGSFQTSLMCLAIGPLIASVIIYAMSGKARAVLSSTPSAPRLSEAN